MRFLPGHIFRRGRLGPGSAATKASLYDFRQKSTVKSPQGPPLAAPPGRVVGEAEQVIGGHMIKFSQNEIIEGDALTHLEGSDTISVSETGIYQISYQLFGIKEGAGSFNFNAALLVNDMIIESTFNDGPVLEDLVNNRITLTSTVILRLNTGDTLKLAGISIEDIEYQKARIDIEKID